MDLKGLFNKSPAGSASESAGGYAGYFQIPQNITYFDSGASSLTCNDSLKKMQEYYSQYRANIHRGAHRLTKKASEEYEAVYEKLGKMFNADAQEFTNVRNATEALNGVALGLNWQAGDEVIATDIEHHSNLLPWINLKEKGVKIKFLRADENGILHAEQLKELISSKTKLIAFTGCSNVVASKVPIQEIAGIAKENKIATILDAAQYVGHHKIDLKKLPIDFMAFSSHKCFGPTGTGVLYRRSGVDLKPWFVGGGTISTASLDSFEFISNRERFEAGTPAIAEWIGFGAAIDFISRIGVDAIEAHDQRLMKAMLEVFQRNDKIELYGPKTIDEKSCALFSFNVKGLKHHETAVMLDELGFALRSGHHCAMPLTKKLNVDGSVRASLHLYNSLTQVQRFEEALKKVSSVA